jgi:sortase A
MTQKRHLSDQKQAATELVRRKLKGLYNDEPPADSTVLHHKAHFDRLVASGASPEQIQQAWHAYYEGLSATEKHRVWQEYYEAQGQEYPHPVPPTEENHNQATVGIIHTAKPSRSADNRLQTVTEVKKTIAHRVKHHAKKVQQNKHVRAISFALVVGSLVLVLNFNELLIGQVKAYLAPGSQTAGPVIIGDGDNQPVGPEPRVIIPKLNVDVPVVYNEQSVEERKVQSALERGVVHYADTPVPGQPGNVVIVGHSSNNLFNSGKYKFAFVLLSRLENNDTFVLHYESQRYIYRVYNKQIVKPTDVSVLGPAAKDHTVTLITCDPPGTAINRLIIQAEQISPEPGTAAQPPATAAPAPKQVPGNSPSLFQRFRNWLFH